MPSNVYRSTTSPVPIDAGHLVTSSITETNYTDCGNVNNRYYAVTAVNENGESDPSNEDRASESCGSAAALTLPVLNVTALAESGGDPVVTKYYFFALSKTGASRVAMARDGVVQYLVGDHLGTTSLVLKADGTVHSEARHYPYGEERWRWPQEGTFPIDYRFTGQRSESGLGLIHMGARFYDDALGRWLSADTIVPGPANPQSFNRYSWVLGNPQRLVDPSGHQPVLPPPIPPIPLIRRILKPVSDFLNHPYVKPLWTNPYIGIPVLYSTARMVAGNATEAQSLTVDWYLELGEAPRECGPESEITQHLMMDEGVQEAREMFKAGGGQDMIGVGAGAYVHRFDSEFFVETPKALLQDDWSGSFLGGYCVEFENQAGYEGPGLLVEVRVLNDTGWASATHIPFTNITTRDNEPRSYPGPGGTLWQIYTWMEVIYVE